MKTLHLILACLLIPSLALIAADASRTGKLYHVVSFKFKENASREQIKAVEEAFRDLKTKIKEIRTLEWGTNVSPEKHNKGFTHGFVLSFKTEKDRNTYLDHPDHKAFVAILKPVLDDALVVDFVPQK